jgi:hypothetical protein
MHQQGIHEQLRFHRRGMQQYDKGNQQFIQVYSFIMSPTAVFHVGESYRLGLTKFRPSLSCKQTIEINSY